jgi:hypothetical protein
MSRLENEAAIYVFKNDAYLKDDPAKEPITARLQRTGSARRSSTQDRESEIGF